MFEYNTQNILTYISEKLKQQGFETELLRRENETSMLYLFYKSPENNKYYTVEVPKEERYCLVNNVSYMPDVLFRAGGLIEYNNKIQLLLPSYIKYDMGMVDEILIERKRIRSFSRELSKSEYEKWKRVNSILIYI